MQGIQTFGNQSNLDMNGGYAFIWNIFNIFIEKNTKLWKTSINFLQKKMMMIFRVDQIESRWFWRKKKTEVDQIRKSTNKYCQQV